MLKDGVTTEMRMSSGRGLRQERQRGITRVKINVMAGWISRLDQTHVLKVGTEESDQILVRPENVAVLLRLDVLDYDLAGEDSAGTKSRLHLSQQFADFVRREVFQRRVPHDVVELLVRHIAPDVSGDEFDILDSKILLRRRDRIAVQIHRQDFPGTNRIEVEGVEAVTAAELQHIGALPDRQQPENSPLAAQRGPRLAPEIVEIEIVIEPPGNGTHAPLKNELRIVGKVRYFAQQAVEGDDCGDPTHRPYRLDNSLPERDSLHVQLRTKVLCSAPTS